MIKHKFIYNYKNKVDGPVLFIYRNKIDIDVKYILQFIAYETISIVYFAQVVENWFLW